jgi:hypothetical protein
MKSKLKTNTEKPLPTLLLASLNLLHKFANPFLETHRSGQIFFNNENPHEFRTPSIMCVYWSYHKGYEYKMINLQISLERCQNVGIIWWPRVWHLNTLKANPVKFFAIWCNFQTKKRKPELAVLTHQTGNRSNIGNNLEHVFFCDWKLCNLLYKVSYINCWIEIMVL